MQTIQQERAAYALKKVNEAIAQKLKYKEYKSHASSFPAMIHMNGLGQAAAFIYSKGKKDEEYRHLYSLLSDWLKEDGQPYYKMDLLEGITQKDMESYRLAQIEALALMDWVKKFAKAFMEENEQEVSK